MRIDDLRKMPLMRLNVRGLVLCQGKWVFLHRLPIGEKRPHLYCPGGRVEPTDRIMMPGKSDLEATLRNALARQIHLDLAAEGIEIGEFLGVSRLHRHSRDVLFAATVETFNFELRTGIDTIDPNLGDIECVTLTKVDKSILSRKETAFFPKEWRKLIGDYVARTKK